MKLPELFDRAEEEFVAHNWDLALQIYLVVVKQAPRFLRARYRVADVLLNLGRVDEAKTVYRALAWHFVRTGQPLMGLVVCKMLIAIDRSAEDMLEVVAEMYSVQSDRVGDCVIPPPLPLPTGVDAAPPFELEPPRLYEWAARISAETEAIENIPAMLPPIPLFSMLPEDAIGPVLRSLKLRRIPDGGAIITEGEEGDAFFMIADGRVTVSKNVDGKRRVLARLCEGMVFGEMALVARGPRTATVSALGEAAVLALSRSELAEHEGQHEAVTLALRKFTRGRLLSNLAATSPMFSCLSLQERRELLRQFRSKMLHAGDIIIEQGEPGRGLFVVLRGRFEVTQSDGESASKIATLKAGDVFGEISLLNNAPTNATVTSLQRGEVLQLQPDDFRRALEPYPDSVAALRELSAERLRAARIPMTTDVISLDENAVLV